VASDQTAQPTTTATKSISPGRRLSARDGSTLPWAAQSRRIAFAEAVAEGYLVAGAHIAFPGIGNVLKEGENFDWLPVNHSDGEAGMVR
jgi:hypothetical protein